MTSYTFSKKEHICRRDDSERLFAASDTGGKGVAFPIRLVFRRVPAAEGLPPVQVLFVVAKRYFKRANKRNRVKRQLREAYRHLKGPLHTALAPQTTLLVAFIWIDNKLHPTATVYSKMEKLIKQCVHATCSDEG